MPVSLPRSFDTQSMDLPQRFVIGVHRILPRKGQSGCDAQGRFVVRSQRDGVVSEFQAAGIEVKSAVRSVLESGNVRLTRVLRDGRTARDRALPYQQPRGRFEKGLPDIPDRHLVPADDPRSRLPEREVLPEVGLHALEVEGQGLGKLQRRRGEELQRHGVGDAEARHRLDSDDGIEGDSGADAEIEGTPLQIPPLPYPNPSHQLHLRSFIHGHRRRECRRRGVSPLCSASA